jgi:hypothetical protein
MKKTLILMALVVLIATEVSCQIRPASKKHYEKFKKSTTYIVQDRDQFSGFNKALKEAMEQHWKITPFKVITFAEFEKLRTNEDASFMVLGDVKQKNISNSFGFINFVMGDKKKDFESMPDLGSVPLAYTDASESDFLYKMGAFVKFMQSCAMDQPTPRMRLASMTNVNDNRIKNMELWLLENELAPDINSEEKLKQNYPHKVKIVTREEISAAIASGRNDVAFMHKIGPVGATRSGRGKCWIFIVSAADGRVLFSSSHDVDRENPDALRLSDIRKIGR